LRGIANIDETLVLILTMAFLASIVLSILNTPLHQYSCLKILIFVPGVVNLVVNFIMSEKFVLNELMYKVIRDSEYRKLVDGSSASVAGPRTLMIILQLLVILISIVCLLISRAKLLKAAVEPTASESPRSSANDILKFIKQLSNKK